MPPQRGGIQFVGFRERGVQHRNDAAQSQALFHNHSQLPPFELVF
jgi:hypothetical protein